MEILTGQKNRFKKAIRLKVKRTQKKAYLITDKGQTINKDELTPNIKRLVRMNKCDVSDKKEIHTTVTDLEEGITNMKNAISDVEYLMCGTWIN